MIIFPLNNKLIGSAVLPGNFLNGFLICARNCFVVHILYKNALVFFIMSSYEEETKKSKNPYHTTLKQYASVSTAHGISYIFEDGRFFLERIIWAAVVVAALAFAICMSISAFHNWKDNPVLTSVKTTGLPIEKIEFPAITICSQGSANEIIDAALFQQFKRYESKKDVEDKSFEKLH